MQRWDYWIKNIIIAGIIILVIGFYAIMSFGSLSSIYSTFTNTLSSSSSSSNFNTMPILNISSVEAEIHEGINNERIKKNLPQLNYDSKLASIAREHSYDMASQNYFSHYSLGGLGPTERGLESGYACKEVIGNSIYEGLGENIYQTSRYISIDYSYLNGEKVSERYNWHSEEGLAEGVVQGWMNSPEHKGNILSAVYRKEGIGVAINGTGVYITEDFC